MSEQARTIAQVETPLGPVLTQLAAGEGVTASAEITQASPQLPARMQVDRVLRIDLRLHASADVAPVHLFCTLEGKLQGSAESGEGLDSIRFRSQGAQLSLATRDACWMLTSGVERKFVPGRLRADPAVADFADWAVRYTPQGVAIEIAALKRGEKLICPLAIAYASAQPDTHDDESTWFAVDYALP